MLLIMSKLLFIIVIWQSFLFKTKEYHEAISYYSRIIQIYEKDQIKFDDKYIYACFYEGICYKNINLIEESYKCLKKINR